MAATAKTTTFIFSAFRVPSFLWLGKRDSSVSFWGNFCLLTPFMQFQT